MAGWEIDFWGKFRRAIESADAGLWADVADYDNVLVSLTADVANVYILIRTLEKRLVIALQNVETPKREPEDRRSPFQYGATSQLDVEQAKPYSITLWPPSRVLKPNYSRPRMPFACY